MGRHFWEKQRGVKSGEPDTELLCPGLPAIKAELKAPGNFPTDRQKEEGLAIEAAGHKWFWADTVEGYGAQLELLGVPLAPNWRLQAQHLEPSEAPKKPGRKPSKPQTTKPTASRVRKVAAIMGRYLPPDPVNTAPKK